MDLGDPGSYLTLEPGVPVYSSDEAQLGKVEQVLADEGKDVFEGIVIDLSALPGEHRFAEATQVASIHERGVVLTISAAEGEGLPEPPD